VGGDAGKDVAKVSLGIEAGKPTFRVEAFAAPTLTNAAP
jgi:hypothetical protein